MLGPAVEQAGFSHPGVQNGIYLASGELWALPGYAFCPRFDPPKPLTEYQEGSRDEDRDNHQLADSCHTFFPGAGVSNKIFRGPPDFPVPATMNYLLPAAALSGLVCWFFSGFPANIQCLKSNGTWAGIQIICPF
ncbi:MAG: hypothetical protein OEZ59_11485 [Deltaproteobacteria bacterium]|nr:hypothetical protein [Deltaproteobacteria bacterium]